MFPAFVFWREPLYSTLPPSPLQLFSAARVVSPESVDRVQHDGTLKQIVMKPTRIVFCIWLAWVLILLGFQTWVTGRLELKYPDRAQEWTTRYTGPGYQQGHVYLLEPFMNGQVAWDSEYYLAIAVGGYDDPRSPQISVDRISDLPGSDARQSLSLSYAFFPFYPLLIRIFAFPLLILGLNPIATAALAGVIVSALGTLLGMLALYDLTRDLLGEEGALRAVFYLIIFPTGFFLLQVYSEGLFVGLAFACLAMVKRKNWLAAALLAAAATLTRAVGIALVIPMLIAWFRTEAQTLEWRRVFQERTQLQILYHALLAVSPLIVFGIWRLSYLGQAFNYVQTNNYERGFLSFGKSFLSWSGAFRTMVAGMEPQSSAYYFTEFLGLAIAVSTCLVCLRMNAELGWFSVAVVLISLSSGQIQSFHRYILASPAVFLVLSHWGRNQAFDRAWTILSLLLMSILAMLFTFNMWVA
jgi:hypothetical protein